MSAPPSKVPRLRDGECTLHILTCSATVHKACVVHLELRVWLCCPGSCDECCIATCGTRSLITVISTNLLLLPCPSWLTIFPQAGTGQARVPTGCDTLAERHAMDKPHNGGVVWRADPVMGPSAHESPSPYLPSPRTATYGTELDTICGVGRMDVDSTRSSVNGLKLLEQSLQMAGAREPPAEVVQLRVILPSHLPTRIFSCPLQDTMCSFVDDLIDQGVVESEVSSIHLVVTGGDERDVTRCTVEEVLLLSPHGVTIRIVY
jgi:hypothetical protein